MTRVLYSQEPSRRAAPRHRIVGHVGDTYLRIRTVRIAACITRGQVANIVKMGETEVSLIAEGTSRAFLDDDFLLFGDTARALFHQVAAPAPIVDLHNHLSPKDIASDRVYETLTDLWLEDDHYKWRAMRVAGFEERFITGDADPWERFSVWAATVPRLVRNPLFIWTHLELRRVFGIDLVLTPETSREIWEEANRQLPRWSARRILSHFDVRIVATTDDPSDDLSEHARVPE